MYIRPSAICRIISFLSSGERGVLEPHGTWKGTHILQGFDVLKEGNMVTLQHNAWIQAIVHALTIGLEMKKKAQKHTEIKWG